MLHYSTLPRTLVRLFRTLSDCIGYFRSRLQFSEIRKTLRIALQKKRREEGKEVNCRGHVHVRSNEKSRYETKKQVKTVFSVGYE